MAPSPPAEGSVPIRTGLWCPAHISPSPFLVAQPGQFSPGFLPESFFAELEEGGLVSSSQLFSPQTLLCHGQAETAESAGTSIVPADFAPLGREQSIVVYRRNAVRVASLTWRLKAKKYPQNPNTPPPTSASAGVTWLSELACSLLSPESSPAQTSPRDRFTGGDNRFDISWSCSSSPWSAGREPKEKI